MTDQWLDGSPLIDDSEQCHQCGQYYTTVYWLPDEVWSVITPSSHSGGGMLCVSCADTRAAKQGFTLKWTAEIDSYSPPPARKAYERRGDDRPGPHEHPPWPVTVARAVWGWARWVVSGERAAAVSH